MIKSPQEEDIQLKLPALFYDCAGLGCAPLYLRTIHGDHQTILHNARYAAEKLISEIAQLCQQAHLYKRPFWHTVSSAKFHQAHTSISSASGVQNLQTIITTQGPGSFTGIRIGLAAAHGFKCTAYQSVYAINRCDLYASIAMKKYKLNHCSFLLQMGKNNYFAGVYKHTHTPTYEHIFDAFKQEPYLNKLVAKDYLSSFDKNFLYFFL